MSPGHERAPGRGGGGSNSGATPQSTTPTQRDRVRRMLQRNWICSIEFIHNPPDGLKPILRYTGRINELRNDGWLIERRNCAHGLHNHGKGVQLYQWRIVGHVSDGQLPGMGNV